MKKTLCLVQLAVMFTCASAFEPISTGIFLGIAALGGAKYYDLIKQQTYCRYNECCTDDNIPFDIMTLKKSLNERLFGQHIAQDKVFTAVASHFKERDKSKKPLVMTFLGTQGTGKNFVSNLIAEAVFEKGTASKYYHVFHGSQYVDSSRLREYQKEIMDELFKGNDQCAYSIFVFDEVDKMPEGIFSSITGMLDHHTLVRGRDFRKAMFIFLTNYGGGEVTRVLHQLTTKKALFRHELKLSHFEENSRMSIYNEKGGLKETDLIKSAVIDFYIPFLPLEEKHIVQCIKAEYQNYGHEFVTPEMVREILNYISFHDVTKYANTGCKTIHPKVRAECL